MAKSRTSFRPGQSGNPGGRPKEVAEVRDLARQHTTAAIETLAALMADEKTPASARVAAAESLLNRGWGKAPQEIRTTTEPDELQKPDILALQEAAKKLPRDPELSNLRVIT